MERGQRSEDLLRFQRYYTLGGQIGIVDLVKRNGCVTPQFHDTFDLAPDRCGVSRELWTILSENLTPTEERRWWKLLGNPSIDDVAADERVSRSAIYITIRGKNGRGGMIAKNPFVELWWVRRQLRTHHERLH